MPVQSAVVEAGDVELSVYGDRFDNKLFELWCLGTIARALADRLNLPEPLIGSGWRRGQPAYSMVGFSGRLDLYFQRSLPAVDDAHRARWAKSSGRRLGGIPDIVAHAQPTIGEAHFAVLDPKLRQRDRLPAEELYKILGYLQNFKIVPAVGAALIYTTAAEAATPDVFHDEDNGTLISTALNPAASSEATAAAVAPVVDTLLGLLGHQPSSPNDQASAGANETEDERAERTISVVRESLANWGNAHLAEIGPSRERIATLVGERRWQALNADVQVMMTTADLVGHQLDASADFSGPVLGMCASIEHIIYTSIIEPVVQGNANLERQTRTFGSAVDGVDQASKARNGHLARRLRAQMDTNQLDHADVLQLTPLWRRLNSRYRVPAAHRKVLTKADWQQLYRLVMGSEELFIRSFDACAPQTVSQE